jgi:hypothetical protein
MGHEPAMSQILIVKVNEAVGILYNTLLEFKSFVHTRMESQGYFKIPCAYSAPKLENLLE